jgi:Replication-relaxation
MSAGRVSFARVRALAKQLSDRDILIVRELHRVKLLTGRQLEQLVFVDHSTNSRGNVRRRVLRRLTGLGIVATLERRIGGVRAGSNGLVYCLGRFGLRLVEHLNGSTPSRTRPPYTPGLTFLSHTLAISEAYVSLVALARTCNFRLRRFDTEPLCWQSDGLGGWLRPDAFLLVENDQYEASWWLEVDQGTEHLARIRTKLRSYERFARNGTIGPDGLLPRVLFGAPNETRATEISREIASEGPRTIVAESVTQAGIAEHIYTQLTA